MNFTDMSATNNFIDAFPNITYMHLLRLSHYNLKIRKEWRQIEKFERWIKEKENEPKSYLGQRLF